MRSALETTIRVQVTALLNLRRWAEAAAAAKRLLAGRPAADDTSDEALDRLAADRAMAAMAFGRVGDRPAAQAAIACAGSFYAPRRSATIIDFDFRLRWAMLEFAEGLLASEPGERRARFSAALAEIAAMPPQPQQLRSVRELKAVLQEELAQVR